jgi:hypothetical protein
MTSDNTYTCFGRRYYVGSIYVFRGPATLIGARNLHDSFSVLNRRRTHDSIMAATNVPVLFLEPILDQSCPPSRHLAGVIVASHPMKAAQLSAAAPAPRMETWDPEI